MVKIKITKRSIQIVLGLLWILDGLLQFQPQMFTSSFTNGVVSLASQGQPFFVTHPVNFFVHIFLTHPLLFNLFIAFTQVIIGVLILLKRTTRIGLSASIGWGLFVWWIGEGLGGIFSGHAMLLMGLPGSALIYVVLALAVMSAKNKPSSVNDKPAVWLPFAWAFFWILGSIYQLLPGQNSASDISSMIASNGSGQPGWLASLDYHVGSLINGFGNPAITANMHMSARQMAFMQTQNGSGDWFILLLALLGIYIGVGVFLPKLYRNLALFLGVIVSVIFWIIGQSFGGIFTGLATDPNSAVVFILMAVAITGCSDPHLLISKLLDRLEKNIT